MIEMMLIPSQREAKMPERRWSKTWKDRTRQGFKVIPFHLISKAGRVRVQSKSSLVWNNIPTSTIFLPFGLITLCFLSDVFF